MNAAVAKTGEVLNNVKNSVNEYMNRPEVKEKTERAKDGTIELAEKAVEALKNWLRPEEDDPKKEENDEKSNDL